MNLWTLVYVFLHKKINNATFICKLLGIKKLGKNIAKHMLICYGF